MLKKIVAVALGLSFVALITAVPGAEAKKKNACPKGQHLEAGACVPDVNPV